LDAINHFTALIDFYINFILSFCFRQNENFKNVLFFLQKKALFWTGNDILFSFIRP